MFERNETHNNPKGKVLLATQYADQGVCTQQLQALIDECAQQGGGQVRLTAGVYLTATLELKSHVELYLDAGAVIRGVDDCSQYRNRYWEVTGKSTENFFATPRWYDALVCAFDQENIAIRGHGIIDGSDCYDENGEQNFRGPHGVFFFRCKNATVEGISVLRAGNYNTMYEECEHLSVTGVHIYGAQDGMRIAACNEVIVQYCDFRTGDDCFSGTRNRNVRIFDCKFNTPGGHTVLLGCINLHMKRCKLWSQGEYPATFKTNKRYSNSWTGFAMLHDCDTPKEIVSDNWLLEDIEMENIETIFRHDRSLYFQEGYAGRVVIDGIKAVNFVYPITLTGIEGDPLDFTLRNGTFVRRTDDAKEDRSFLRADGIKSLTIDNVVVENAAEELAWISNVDHVNITDLKALKPAAEGAVRMEDVREKSMTTRPVKTTADLYVFDKVDSIYIPIDQTEELRGPLRWNRP